MRRSIRPLAVLVALLASVAACRGSGSNNPPAEPETPAAAKEPQEPEDSAGFAGPLAPEAPPEVEAPAKASPELTARIQRDFGERCRYERSCGELVGVDCDSAVDGPYYYVHRETLAVVSTCGGACMSGSCTNCPPSVWTCPTY
jgi:hypothetical protein